MSGHPELVGELAVRPLRPGCRHLDVAAPGHRPWEVDDVGGPRPGHVARRGGRPVAARVPPHRARAPSRRTRARVPADHAMAALARVVRRLRPAHTRSRDAGRHHPRRAGQAVRRRTRHRMPHTGVGRANRRQPGIRCRRHGFARLGQRTLRAAGSRDRYGHPAVEGRDPVRRLRLARPFARCARSLPVHGLGWTRHHRLPVSEREGLGLLAVLRRGRTHHPGRWLRLRRRKVRARKGSDRTATDRSSATAARSFRCGSSRPAVYSTSSCTATGRCGPRCSAALRSARTSREWA